MQHAFCSAWRCKTLITELTACAFALPTLAEAAYPDKPVRIVVGFSAGGSTDVIARVLAKQLTESLGQAFVV